MKKMMQMIQKNNKIYKFNFELAKKLKIINFIKFRNESFN